MRRELVVAVLAAAATTPGDAAAVAPATRASPPATTYRRRALLHSAGGVGALLLLPRRSAAAAALSERVDSQFGYRLAYPDDWSDASKPVRTHLHELLLSSPQGRGVKLGVTVDPVKIDSLEAFGNLDQARAPRARRPRAFSPDATCTLPPWQVTQRVLGVEQTRDGVQSVTLRANAAQAADAAAGVPSYYTIEYVTVSSRGTKLFSCKYCIANKKLYVLQAQANLAAYDADEEVRAALRGVVGSFEVAVS
jgi:hypothetical protein